MIGLAVTLFVIGARAEELPVGHQETGLVGLGRVAVAADGTRGFTGAGGIGYGLTNDSGTHHRVGGTLAAAVQPLRFLSGGLMLAGRWEKHPDDVLGASSTTVGEPRLTLRAAGSLVPAFALGAQVGVLVPGGEAPSLRFDATTVDAQLLATFIPAGTNLVIAFNGGYRFDQSANAVDGGNRARIRPGDRLTLALSDSDAALVGLGIRNAFGRTELFAEGTFEAPVGGSVSGGDGPFRVGFGVRHHAGDSLELELRGESMISGARSLAPTDPLVRVDPTLAVIAGLRWTLPFDKKVVAPPPKADETVTKPVTPQIPRGTIQGKVVAASGEPLANAHVTVTWTNAEGTGEKSTVAGPDGSFRVTDVPVGDVHVVAKAPGHDDLAFDTSVAEGAAATADFVLKKTIKPGQLRGLVRSFSGKPLSATIRIEPIGTEVKTDAEGTFTVDLPPGSYDVVVSAPGHAGQKRPVTVEENGVTILNADLHPGGK